MLMSKRSSGLGGRVWTLDDVASLGGSDRIAVELREGFRDGRQWKWQEIAGEMGSENRQAAQMAYRRGIKKLEALGGDRAVASVPAVEEKRVKVVSSRADVSSEVTEAAILAVEKMYPTLGHVPNVAQRRMFAPWKKAPYPFMVVSSCGNGAGKSNALVQDIAACCLGPDFVNDCWNREKDGTAVGLSDHRYYHDIKKSRESGTFQYRLLCGPEDLKESSGPLYKEIKRWIPTADFKGKTSQNGFRSIEIPLPGNPKIKNVIDVKTFDQDITTHAGATLDRIGINEPCGYDVFSETIARMRSEKGKAACTILVNATILDKATWLFDLQNDDYFASRVVFAQGSMWENCAGEEITEEIANELFDRLGVLLERDAQGRYLTYGRLTKQSIDDIIHFYMKTDPNQIEARIWGANVQLFGAEFKTFNAMVHIKPTGSIPKNVPIIHTVDPHPVKNDMAAWSFLNPMERLTFFHESPSEIAWEKMAGRNKTIEQICAEWSNLEDRMGISDQVVIRLGDPNRFLTSDSRDNLALWQLYAEHGFHFNLFIRDDLEYGHQCIHSRLYFNKEIYKISPDDTAAQPGLSIWKNCTNLTSGLRLYGRKGVKDITAALSEKIDELHKDKVDLIRYTAVWLKDKTYRELWRMPRVNSTGGDDYAKIQAGRDIGPSGSGIPQHKLKGRTFAGHV